MGVYSGIAQDNVKIISGTADALTVADATLTNATISGGTATVSRLLNTGMAPPAIKTAATHTVGDDENCIIYNGAAANVTVTLPSAATSTGRVIFVKNLSSSYTVISASSNVKPISSDSAGTAILAGTAGAWAMLVSNGSHWIVMAS
jgi:hypothetical protein